MAKTAKPKPQTTIVSVAVTTAGPVSMTAVREAVGIQVQHLVGFTIDGEKVGAPLVTSIRVKRDANIERPNR